MARTFDDLITVYSIWFFDSVTPAWTQRNVTTGDYFSDTATVGDCLYFILRTDRNTHDLRFNVGTALAATSITIAWEFYHYDNTWHTLTVVDGTNSFQTTGLNWVTWTIPDGWTSFRLADAPAGTGKPTSPSYWHAVRARITAVSGLTEGGANTTNGIATYGDAITIPAGESVTLADLYADDVAGSWGVVTRDADARHYVIDASVINYGTLTIQNWEQVQIGSEARWKSFYNQSGGTITAGAKSGNDQNQGARIIYYNHTGYDSVGLIAGSPIVWAGTFNCTNSYFWKRGSPENPSFSGNNYMYSSIFECSYQYYRWYFPSTAGVGEVKDSIFSGPNNNSSRGLYFYSSDIALENIKLGMGAQITLGANNANLTNTRIPSGKKITTTNSRTCYATDCIFEDAYSVHHANTASTEFNVMYTLVLTVLDVHNNTISTPHVRIVDSQSQELFNGDWSTDLVVKVWKKNVGTITDYCPLEIWISKDGYETYYQKLTLTSENRKMTVKLRHSPTPGRDDMGDAFR